MIIIRANVTEIIFACEDDNVLSEFCRYGFNMRADLKRCGVDMKFIESIRESILLTVNTEMLSGRPRYCIAENGKAAICVLKERYPNKKANRGASYGFRILLLIDGNEHVAYAFHIYDKVNKKDLTEHEKKSILEMIDS